MYLYFVSLLATLSIAACARLAARPNPDAKQSVVTMASSSTSTSVSVPRLARPSMVLPEVIDRPLEVAAGSLVHAERDVLVAHGGQLTIGAGAILSFASGVGLYLAEGNLVVQGTAEQPVRFTSAAERPAPGDWGGIWFTSLKNPDRAPESVVDHAIVEYGGRAHGTLAKRRQYQDANGGIFVGTEWNRSRPLRPIVLRHILLRNNANRGLDAPEDVAFRAEDLTFGANDGVSARVEVAVAEQLGTSATETVELVGTLREGKIVLPKQRKPYLIRRAVMIGMPGPTTLEIADGTVVQFGEKARLDVGALGSGTLIAKGVTFTSAAETPGPGDWNGIWVTPGGSLDLESCIVEYAASSRKGAVHINSTDRQVHIVDTIFRHNAGPAIYHFLSCKRWIDPKLGNTSEGNDLCQKR